MVEATEPRFWVRRLPKLGPRAANAAARSGPPLSDHVVIPASAGKNRAAASARAGDRWVGAGVRAGTAAMKQSAEALVQR